MIVEISLDFVSARYKVKVPNRAHEGHHDTARPTDYFIFEK